MISGSKEPGRLRITKRFAFTALGAGLILMLIANATSLLISPSDSLQQRVFLLLKGTAVHKGQYAAIQGHSTAYFSNLLYTKRIYAVAGDRIDVCCGFIWINGRKRLRLLDRTAKGQPLTPLKAQVVPEGYVFAAADHPRSFDSRYQEFGLVAERRLLGRAWGLF